MTVSIEVFAESYDTTRPSRYCIARKKISVQGIYSQAVEVCGQYDNTKITNIFITFRCPTCSVSCYRGCEVKNVVIWEESTQEFSDSVSCEVEVEEGECVNCALIALNKCDLPCYNDECEQHDPELYEFDPYEGWTKKD